MVGTWVESIHYGAKAASLIILETRRIIWSEQHTQFEMKYNKLKAHWEWLAVGGDEMRERDESNSLEERVKRFPLKEGTCFLNY